MAGGSKYYLSQSAYDEFQSQDVFPTLEEFAAAMPPATKSIHLIPSEMVDLDQVADKDSLVSVTAALDSDLFGPLTQVNVNPTREDPSTNDTSIFQVDDTNDLLKEQTEPDSSLKDIHPHINSPQNDTQTWEKHHHPGDSDDYKRNNLNRDYANSSTGNQRPGVLIPWEVWYTSRTALTWGEITSGLNPAVVSNSDQCTVSLKRSDPKNSRWTFVVSSASNKPYVVNVQGIAKKNSAHLDKVDLKIACSCDFWKWQGPDHWASANGYLDRKPRSDGSVPMVRDPSGQNKVCKHVYAASKFFLKYQLQKTAGTKHLATSEMMGTKDAMVIHPKASSRIRKLSLKLSTYT